MTNLKEKILQALQNSNKVDSVLENISQAQENLLKNHSNPVFNQADKNKILKKYIDLQNLGQSLYRFGKLAENNYLADAKKEQENIKNTVLEGGVCYYVWHSEDTENTCGVCKSRDGKIFNCEEDVPERPHPNCRCTVEFVTKTKPVPPKVPTPQPTPAPKSQKWIMPCNGPITSKYGKRKPPVPGASDFHNGWDIGVPIGTPVKAIANGKIIAVGPARGYGNWVVIDHGIINGIHVTSEYGHISSWNVKYGQIIKQGDIIAKSGNAGYSSGPHLHITIKEGKIFQGNPVDPAKYIKTNF